MDILIFAIVNLLLLGFKCTHGLSPIVIVPGIRGSQLEAKISDGSPCDTNGSWESYWINLQKSPACVNRILTLVYDNATNSYSNSSGIEVRVAGFGTAESVEFLDTTKQVQYFNAFVNFFSEKGYVRGENIRGAPYDWRLAPDGLQQQGYYRMLQDLVVEMQQDSNEKVTIVAHSMGGPVVLYFLNQYVTQQWKDQYIHAFIPLSAAWAGGNGGLITFVSEISVENNAYLTFFTSSYKSMGSSVWLLPNPDAWGDKELIFTATKSYSAENFQEMFQDINRTEDYYRFNRSLSINGKYPSPNVPVFCYYGINVSTPETFTYGTDFPGSFINMTNGDGDGAVNLISSQVCLRWSNQTAPFEHRTFSLAHIQMVTNDTVLEAVYNVTINNCPGMSISLPLLLLTVIIVIALIG